MRYQSSSVIRSHLSDMERLALLVGSLSHDLDHRGTNNQFQIKYVLFGVKIHQFGNKIY